MPSASGPRRGSYTGQYERPKIKDPELAAEAERLNEKGMEHYRRNDYKAARKSFEKAIKIDPEYAEPYHHLFAVYQNLGDIDKAMGALSKFIRYAGPDNPARQDALALMRAVGLD
jgi:Tfp pilus assembly protein PilF